MIHVDAYAAEGLCRRRFSERMLMRMVDDRVEKIMVGGPQRNVADSSQEDTARPKRRTFTAEYKRRFLAEVDACARGQAKLIIRREGLYPSHVDMWRRQRAAGELAGLAPKKRGRKARAQNPLQSEVERLRREAAELHKWIHQASIIIAMHFRLPV